MVQIYGRVGVNAYIGRDGEAKGVLTFHVSEIKLFGGVPKNGEAKKVEVERKAEPQERTEVKMEQGVASDSAIKPSNAFDDAPGVETGDLPF